MPEYRIVKYAYESDEDKLKYSVDDIAGTEEAVLEEDKGPVAAIKLAVVIDGECVVKVVTIPNRGTRSIDIENIWVKEGYERSLHKYNLIKKVVSLDTFQTMCAVFGFKPYREVIDDLGASKHSGYRVQKPPYSDILVFNELYDDDEIDRYEKIVRMKQIRSLCTLCVSPFEADREYKLVEKINAKRGV